MSVLEIRNLSKSFGAVQVSRDISLSVAARQCHALIGPNGAGKTTLIHQVSGVLRPDAGRVLLDGRDITADPIWRRARAGLGRTFQITSVLPSFSVRENVALAAQAKAGSSMRFFAPAAAEAGLNRCADSVLERIRMADRAGVLAADLSHGERRLLELGIALAGAPKFLLLDEPMAGLGRAESLRLGDILEELRREIPMLLVEHDMDAIFRLADTVSVLVEGRVVARGTPDQVRADPAARAAYLGDGGSGGAAGGAA
ncbi:branched-chain amino acid ABC transporter substrate-binding protein [Defluviimonas sp. 20V17]|uniref:ABC transporter ATP-binding protein n=1 Tax=Allgaiera indica TaxID=765699 RepID=A0AAN4UQY3_9RHOB|nr:ABC transporter ATP-binding protein [Allgaiera indica]KDB03275.1 branched-chain amino acid ABC transporter substrate-binding protein [Defluviimonas sp. 20V17]GHE00577.1 ABC transporter ATP-binding protein [Allgaiera indica]SDW59463.1 amino acid/amide ABC transporter ATP-binding protein 1, HAAT family [Allgaiera indica]